MEEKWGYETTQSQLPKKLAMVWQASQDLSPKLINNSLARDHVNEVHLNEACVISEAQAIGLQEYKQKHQTFLEAIA